MDHLRTLDNLFLSYAKCKGAMEEMNDNRKEVIIVIIELSQMKRFFMMDMGIGTLSYYLVKMINGNIIIDLIGSTIITEGVKRVYKGMNNKGKKNNQINFKI